MDRHAGPTSTCARSGRGDVELNAARGTAVAALVALRRLRARPGQTLILAACVGGAAALLALSSVVAALSHENAVEPALAERPIAERSLRIGYRLPAAGEDRFRGLVERSLRPFAGATERARFVQVWNPIELGNGDGVRIVRPADGVDELSLLGGRAPRPCDESACDAVSLTPAYRVGERVELDGAVVLVTGRGTLGPRAFVQPELLGERALLVPEPRGALGAVLARRPSGVVATAVFRPEAVHSPDLRPLVRRLEETSVRLERTDRLFEVEAPFAALRELIDRGDVARERLLLVAGQGAALILAFAAFAAQLRREDVRRLDDQLTTFGATRAQVYAARVVEAALPSLAGALAALLGVRIAVELLARERNLDDAWISSALPGWVVLAVAVLALAATAILVAASNVPRRRRFGLGPAEIAAVVAFVVVVWQLATTGGLDAEEVAAGESAPALLLLPGLILLVAAVVLLRLLPAAFRSAERLARRAPTPVQLGLLAAARNPIQAAAATTFLAVALGSALFSLAYRATLEAHAAEQAAFRVGAEWRVTESGERREVSQRGATDVSPLTRYARISAEEPTPVLRLAATVSGAETHTSLTLVGVPSERLAELRGWRGEFSELSRSEIAERLRAERVSLRAPRLSAEATGLRLWARSRSDLPRFLVFHLLLPGQRFEQVVVDRLTELWSPHAAEIPRGFAGAEVVAIQFPTRLEAGDPGGDNGYVDAARLEERIGGRWRPVEALVGWRGAKALGGLQSVAEPARHPGRGEGVRYRFNGTFWPFMRPAIELPESVPALVSPAIGAAAVDGQVDLSLPIGTELKVDAAAVARLFPTVLEGAERFAVVDYDTLFAVLNADFPGHAPPAEAWFFRGQRPGFELALARPPFRVDTALGRVAVEERLRSDPLAGGTSWLLLASTLTAAGLALLGLVLATRSALAAESALNAEYEAIGVPPEALRLGIPVRVAALSVFGIAAALPGAAIAGTLVAGYVAVSAAGETALPPIEARAAWGAGLAAVGLVAALALASSIALAARAFRQTAAARLRA